MHTDRIWETRCQWCCHKTHQQAGLYDSQHNHHCLSWCFFSIKILIRGKRYWRGQKMEVDICIREVGRWVVSDRNPSLRPWLYSLPGAWLSSHIGKHKSGQCWAAHSKLCQWGQTDCGTPWAKSGYSEEWDSPVYQGLVATSKSIHPCCPDRELLQ